MLYDILNYLGILRYGVDSKLVKEIYQGDFEIENGAVNLPDLSIGCRYVINGSLNNDGAYTMGIDDTLTDEKFTGTVYLLRNCKPFFDLVDEMQQWQQDNAAKVASPYTSESFGGYSYTKDTSADTVFSNKLFATRLAAWRKL